MKITKKGLEKFKKDYKKAVKNLEEKYDVSIFTEHIRYNRNEFKFKTRVENTSAGEKPRKETKEFWKNYVSKFSNDGIFINEAWGMKLNSGHKVIGINTRAHKNKVMLRKNGKRYSCTFQYVKNELKSKHTKIKVRKL